MILTVTPAMRYSAVQFDPADVDEFLENIWKVTGKHAKVEVLYQSCPAPGAVKIIDDAQGTDVSFSLNYEGVDYALDDGFYVLFNERVLIDIVKDINQKYKTL